MSSQLSLRKSISLEELLNAIWKLPVDNQLALAEKVRKKALRNKWNDFMKRPDVQANISEDEIIAEVKSVRAVRYARRKK
jgi:hypothetical protein